MDENYLHDYDVLKVKMRRSVHNGKFKEVVLSRRVTVSYFDAGKIGKMIMKDTKKYLMTYDPVAGGIIAGVGKFKMLPNQFVYGIQPYMHIEYRIQVLILHLGAVVKCKITGSAKNGKLAGEVFDRIPAVVNRSTCKDSAVGKTLSVCIKSLLPIKRGPCALYCLFKNAEE